MKGESVHVTVDI